MTSASSSRCFRPRRESAPDQFDLALLEERVAAAAVAAVGEEEQEFAVFVRDADEVIVAGISGSVWGGCCQLHAMWVDERFRRRGIARELMGAAELEAEHRGARLVMFFAYDNLSVGLYERLGYGTVGAIDDCPSGTTTRWYRKDLHHGS